MADAEPLFSSAGEVALADGRPGESSLPCWLTEASWMRGGDERSCPSSMGNTQPVRRRTRATSACCRLAVQSSSVQNQNVQTPRDAAVVARPPVELPAAPWPWQWDGARPRSMDLPSRSREGQQMPPRSALSACWAVLQLSMPTGQGSGGSLRKLPKQWVMPGFEAGPQQVPGDDWPPGQDLAVPFP